MTSKHTHKIDKSKKNALTAGSIAGLAGLVSASKAYAGGDGGSGGGGGYAPGDVETGKSIAEAAGPGALGGYAEAVGCDNVGDASLGGGPSEFPTTSTPFLLVWDGTKYVYENDFLFGKPNTAFANFDQGLQAYAAGIGADAYILQTKVVGPATDNLLFRIKEIEPEESYIDSVQFYSVDIPHSARMFVDGDLDTLRVFDTHQVCVFEQMRTRRYYKTGFEAVLNDMSERIDGFDKTFSPQLLQPKDQIIIEFESSSQRDDVWILVGSHYRDWTIAEDLPFSRFEEFKIRSAALFARAPEYVASILIATGLIAGAHVAQPDQPLFKTSVAHADTRSLVVTVEVNGAEHYLQTIFPRYIKSVEEVVRIPQELLTDAVGKIKVRIAATKKHIVTNALVFSAMAQQPEEKELHLLSAVHSRLGDVTENLRNKNELFTHTQPLDQIDLTLSADTTKLQEGYSRYTLLRASGFYTALSDKTRKLLPDNWFQLYAKEDRSMLRRLRTLKSYQS